MYATATPQVEVDPLSEALQRVQSTELPTKARQSFQEGLQCLQSGEAAPAVAALSRSVEQAPNFAPARIFLGIAHALTNNIYPAIDQLERATELEPDSFGAHFALAQLNFKLRIPQKGYEAAERARQCIASLEQRKMLTQLLKEERARERNGIARPCFDKAFSTSSLLIVCIGLLAAIVAIAIHMH